MAQRRAALYGSARAFPAVLTRPEGHATTPAMMPSNTIAMPRRKTRPPTSAREAPSASRIAISRARSPTANASAAYKTNHAETERQGAERHQHGAGAAHGSKLRVEPRGERLARQPKAERQRGIAAREAGCFPRLPNAIRTSCRRCSSAGVVLMEILRLDGKWSPMT